MKTGKFPFLANSKATILGQHEGFIKVVAEAKYGEILGVHAIGPLATEIIAEPVAALGLEATLDDMAATIHAHPTVWEAMGDAFNSRARLDDQFLARSVPAPAARAVPGARERGPRGLFVKSCRKL